MLLKYRMEGHGANYDNVLVDCTDTYRYPPLMLLYGIDGSSSAYKVLVKKWMEVDLLTDK